MLLRRVASWVLLLCCSAVVLPAWAQKKQGAARAGSLRLLTYNVAGLPEGLSAVHPVSNLPRVGALLQRYDFVLVQEDYAYPALLRQRLRLPYSSPPFVRGNALHFGDGLSQFGKLAFGATERRPWSHCHGLLDSYFDCLTPKGLAMVRVELSPGVSLDVYNVHLDAGPGLRDQQARAEQLKQLAKTLLSLSGNRAVVVGGDFNLSWSEMHRLYAFADAAGLRDSCTTLQCREPWRIDRVLVRSSPALSLTPRAWSVDLAFRDLKGRPLSDHLAVAVVLDWVASEPAEGAGTFYDAATRHGRSSATLGP